VLVDVGGERLLRQLLVAREQTSGKPAMYFKTSCSTAVISGRPPNWQCTTNAMSPIGSFA
jgi:hypothetical protein